MPGGSLFSTVLLLLFFALAGSAGAQPNLAEGFSALPKNSKVAIIPTDIELFSISGGGVLEPKADWTEAASRHFKAALIEKKKSLGATTIEMSAQPLPAPYRCITSDPASCICRRKQASSTGRLAKRSA
ncbi:MAG: hypothetical protein HYU73_23425 [Betaproteobacteria bacterium]|nr:hypothetical protein [Betaproteobacteria bacterium]